MSQTAFSTVSTNLIAAQPTVGAQVYLRAGLGASNTVTVYGDITAAPDSEAIVLNGITEVQSVDGFDSITQAILSAAESDVVTAYDGGNGTAAEGDIRTDINPSDGDTISIGDKTYRFKNTLAAIDDVKIGANATDTTLSLKRAINLDGTAGVDYYAGTTINGIYSANVATTVITITDKIRCVRQIDPSFSESASNFSLRRPIGGIDGTLLFTLAAGILSAANPLTFSTEDHLTETLPALMLGTSNAINVQGNQAMLRLWADNAISYKIQSSTDQINWTDTSEGTVALSASTLTYVTLAELAEFIRLVITTNANTTDTIFDARVIY